MSVVAARSLPSREPDRRPLVLVTSSLEGGGAQRAFAKLASGMVAEGREVDLVVGRATGPNLALVDPRVRVVDLGVGRFAAALGPLARHLRRTRPTAVYSALDYVNVVTVAAHRLSRCRARLVVSERNTLSVGAENATRRASRLMPHLVRRVYPMADAVVAVSEGVADDLVGRCGIPSAKVSVLDNPIVTPELLRMKGDPVPHAWLGGEVPVVLAVGRFVPQKDFRTLVDAFAEVRRRRPARLLVLGEGPLRAELERQVTALGIEDDVALPGFVANPYPAMAAASVFVLASRWEGSPGVLIEALACGVPVVSTDCPSGPRQVLAGGRHGRLVPVGDPSAMADCIAAALGGEVATPGVESWARFRQADAVGSCLRLLEGVG